MSFLAPKLKTPDSRPTYSLVKKHLTHQYFFLDFDLFVKIYAKQYEKPLPPSPNEILAVTQNKTSSCFGLIVRLVREEAALLSEALTA